MTAAFLAQLATAAVVLLHLLMASAAWLMLRGPRQRSAVRLWAAGTLAMGLGLATTSLADAWPAALHFSLSLGLRLGLLPALLLAALLLRLLALRRHLGRPLHLGAGGALVSLASLASLVSLVALVALGAALCLQSDDPRVWPSYANAVLIVGTAITGRQAWHASHSRGGGRTARWVAWTEWLLCAALVLRAFGIAAAVPAGGRWDWWLAAATAALAALFGNLGFLGMVLDDLHRAELLARQAQIDETAGREAAEQTALALQALLAQRDALAGEREAMLQMLAQEIRAPLHSAGLAMQAAVQLLRGPRTASAAQVSTQLLQAQGVLGEVRAVLDNSLAAATLLSRQTPLVRQEVALDFLVALTLGDLAAQQRERLTVQWLTDVDSLEVEPGLVRLALRNLLHNAFVHGGPRARVSLRLDELRASHSLRMLVTDDGPGIAAAHLQSPPLGASAPGRRRLGLSVVRQVMDLHGGQLLLGNALPRGCVAQLVFPLSADDRGLHDAPAEPLSVAADDAPAHAQAASSGARKT